MICETFPFKDTARLIGEKELDLRCRYPGLHKWADPRRRWKGHVGIFRNACVGGGELSGKFSRFQIQYFIQLPLNEE